MGNTWILHCWTLWRITNKNTTAKIFCKPSCFCEQKLRLSVLRTSVYVPLKPSATKSILCVEKCSTSKTTFGQLTNGLCWVLLQIVFNIACWWCQPLKCPISPSIQQQWEKTKPLCWRHDKCRDTSIVCVDLQWKIPTKEQSRSGSNDFYIHAFLKWRKTWIWHGVTNLVMMSKAHESLKMPFPEVISFVNCSLRIGNVNVVLSCVSFSNLQNHTVLTLEACHVLTTRDYLFVNTDQSHQQRNITLPFACSQWIVVVHYGSVLTNAISFVAWEGPLAVTHSQTHTFRLTHQSCCSLSFKGVLCPGLCGGVPGAASCKSDSQKLKRFPGPKERKTKTADIMHRRGLATLRFHWHDRNQCISLPPNAWILFLSGAVKHEHENVIWCQFLYPNWSIFHINPHFNDNDRNKLCLFCYFYLKHMQEACR